MKRKKVITVIIILCVLVVLAVLIELFLSFRIKSLNEQSFLGWSDEKKVNEPDILEGMIPVMYEEGSSLAVATTQEIIDNKSWYDYAAQENTTENGGTSKWANVKTDDGSYWVWIPRFAYKITYINPDNKTKGGNIDVMFLKGTTNKNKNDVDVTTLGYIVHPTFKNGNANNYKNGEWDKELKGIWISKFEAGYTAIKNTNTENIITVKSEELYEHSGKNIKEAFSKDVSKLDYPIFAGQTYTYNNLQLGEMFKLSRALTATNNPYGFSDVTTDSHLMKNSEWGAVAYLAYSQYGRNGTKITINNIAVEEDANSYESETQALVGHDNVNFVYAITGYAGEKIQALKYIINNNEKLLDKYDNESYAWYTKEGKLASSTGNLYGIYDLNGGASEYVSCFISGISNDIVEAYAKSMITSNESNKYYTIYNNTYDSNDKIGDALVETSEGKGAYNSWHNELSFYAYDASGFVLRSGNFDIGKRSGIFAFEHHSGHDFLSYTFRPVLVRK